MASHLRGGPAQSSTALPVSQQLPPEKRRRVEGEGPVHVQLHPQPRPAQPAGQLHPAPPQLHPGQQRPTQMQLHPNMQQHQQQQTPQIPNASARMVCQVMFRSECIIGKGSFGLVYKALNCSTGQPVAIKAVKQRIGEYNVEDQVLRRLRGSPNIVTLLGTFPTGRGEEHRLNLVLEFLADTLSRIIKHHRHMAMFMDMHYVRLYMFQLFRGLACLDRHRIVHRDLKPANLLVDPATRVLKICDFGTAKNLETSSSDNQPYVCSRYYRAPELILSTPDYGTSVDLWSTGCVFAEMLLGQPLFPGKDGVDQLGEIIQILGTPTAAEFYAMNPEYDAAVGFNNRVEPIPWDRVLRRKVGADAVELLGRLLQYDPSLRPHPLDSMASNMFTPLWQAVASGQLDPSLFNLSENELAGCTHSGVCNHLRTVASQAGQMARQIQAVTAWGS